MKTEEGNYELRVILSAGSVGVIQDRGITVCQLTYAKWDHIVFTRRVFVGADYVNYNYRTFLNGAEIHSITVDDGAEIGHVYMNGGYIEGSDFIASRCRRYWNSVRIYNRALDDEEIQYLYQNKL